MTWPFASLPHPRSFNSITALFQAVHTRNSFDRTQSLSHHQPRIQSIASFPTNLGISQSNLHPSFSIDNKRARKNYTNMKFLTLFSLAIFATPAAAFTATTCPSSINRMSGSSLAMGSPFFTSTIATALDKEVSELITLHWIVPND